MLRHLARLATQAPEHPLRHQTIYYLILAAIVTTVLLIWPSASECLAGGSSRLQAFNPFTPDSASPTVPAGGRFDVALYLVVSMMATLLLMLPVSWSYMGPRRFIGFDQAVVQTIVVLPIAVAGIVVMVQNSVALAFSLAGIVAGVRFRANLKTTADGLFVFAAIGVGFACGAGEIAIAAVISVFFNYVVLGLWWSSYGSCPVGGPAAGLAASAQPNQKKKNKKKHDREESDGPLPAS